MDQPFIHKYRPLELKDFEMSPKIKELLETLVNADLLNILLVGNSGCGKTSLIKEIYKDTLKLFKTESGSYVFDKADLKIGDQTENPTLLVKETVVRGKITKDNYSPKYEPSGALFDGELNVSIFYKDAKQKGSY